MDSTSVSPACSPLLGHPSDCPSSPPLCKREAGRLQSFPGWTSASPFIHKHCFYPEPRFVLCTHRGSPFRRGDVCFRRFYLLLYQTPPGTSLFQAAHLGTLPCHGRQGLVLVWFFNLSERAPASSAARTAVLGFWQQVSSGAENSPTGENSSFSKDKSLRRCLSLRRHPQ